jgi:hypothetical protein
LSFGTASFGRIDAIANRANPARQIQLAGRLKLVAVEISGRRMI